MNISGFQKNSLIDFPKTIACVVFTQGCNLACPYCHNPDLIAHTPKEDTSLYDETRVFEFLKKRKGLLQGVVITGGEPSLQKDLLMFCQKVKDMGYKLKLDTNGTNPETLAMLFENNLVDFVAMDIKTSLENYDLAAKKKIDKKKILKSARLLMEKAPEYEFRTTCCKPFINKDILNDIGKMINKASKYVLQKCSRNIKGLDPKFLKEDNNFFSDKQMFELKETIDKYVMTSIIR